MTFIAEGGGRTVTNGTVYDARKVYECKGMAILDEVQSVYGTGEVERTGKQVHDEFAIHIVARDEGLARALFAKNWRPDRYRLDSVTPLFVIDGEITSGHG